MTAHRLTNWIMAAIIAGAMSTAYMLDSTPSDTTTRIHTSQSVTDAQKQARQQARFDKAARKLCGGGKSAYELLADGSIQCLTLGMTTITAKVAL